jgi:SAM-dependent methyltransferase
MSEWDAVAYNRLAEPQFAWGTRVLDRLALRGDETVMDAGCGTGRLTELLLERLPQGRVLAVDHSRNMLDAARTRLARLATVFASCTATSNLLACMRPSTSSSARRPSTGYSTMTGCCAASVERYAPVGG